jgi:hypothetical protein
MRDTLEATAGRTCGQPSHLRVRRWSQIARLCLRGVIERATTLLVIAHP